MGSSHDDPTLSMQIDLLGKHIPGYVHIIRIEPDGRIRMTYASAGITDVFGVSPEAALLDIGALRKTMTPDGEKRFDDALQVSLKNKKPFTTCYTIRHPAKGIRWLESRSDVQFEPDGTSVFFGFTHDVTERVRLEETLRVVASPGDDACFFSALARHMGDMLGAAYIAIDKIADTPEFAQTLALYAHGEILPNMRYALAGTPCANVMGKRTCCYGNDVQALFPEDDLLVEMGVQSYAGTPLWNTNGEAIGLIAVMDTKPFDDEASVVQLLQAVAPRAAAQLMQEEGQRLLAQREEELRSLIENMPTLIVRYDNALRRIYVNPAWEAATGLSASEVIGQPFIGGSGTHVATSTAYVGALKTALATGMRQELEFPWKDKNGETRFLHYIVLPEFDESGSTKSLLGVGYDLTERKALDKHLRLAASVFGAAHDGILITDRHGRILDVNPAFTRITGFNKSDAIGRFSDILTYKQQGKAFYREVKRHLVDSACWSGELINRRKHGDTYSALVNITANRDPDGRISHYIATLTDITKLKEHEKHLVHMAHHDPLTGLANRRLLTERMTLAIAQTKRSGKMLAVLYLDLDGFKPINDEHGHQVGDSILIEIAARLTQGLRPTDTLARIGGDEFVILMTDVTNLGECEDAAQRLLDIVGTPIVLGERSFAVSASIGISLYPNDETDDADILLRHADQAMYRAKSGGRNHFVFFGREARRKAKLDNETIRDLRTALRGNQIVVHYQPIIDIQTHRLVKAEALVRWYHPARGIVSPSEFIPVAEQIGLIHEIGDFVFRDAARLANIVNDGRNTRVDGAIRISVNRSPNQFARGDGIDAWMRYLTDEGIPGECLCVEITEGLLLEDEPQTLKQLDQLRSMNIAIALDDFGTGYSALSYLKKFDIDCLKIDRSFINDIAEDPSDRAIVEAIIAMAKRLNIELVAEGVETKEQAEILAAAGCHMAQGFLYARPMPADAFLEYAKRWCPDQALTP